MSRHDTGSPPKALASGAATCSGAPEAAIATAECRTQSATEETASCSTLERKAEERPAVEKPPFTEGSCRVIGFRTRGRWPAPARRGDGPPRLLELQVSAPIPAGETCSPGRSHWCPLRPVCRRSRGFGILDGRGLVELEELGGGVVGRASCPTLGVEGTEEPPPPPDVAPGNEEGGIWCEVPMPNVSMKSETSSKLVEIGAGIGESDVPPESSKD